MAFKIIPLVTKVSSGEIKLTFDDETELTDSTEDYTLAEDDHDEAESVILIITKDNGKTIKTIHLKDTSANDDGYEADDIDSDPDYVVAGSGFNEMLGDGYFITSSELYDTEIFEDGYYEFTVIISCSVSDIEDSGVGITYFLNQVLELVHKATIYDQKSYPKEFYQVEKSMRANILLYSLEIAGAYKKQLVFDKQLMTLKNLLQ